MPGINGHSHPGVGQRQSHRLRLAQQGPTRVFRLGVKLVVGGELNKQKWKVAGAPLLTHELISAGNSVLYCTARLELPSP